MEEEREMDMWDRELIKDMDLESRTRFVNGEILEEPEEEEKD